MMQRVLKKSYYLNKLAIGATFVFLILVLSGCTKTDISDYQKNENILKIAVLDVGKADAIVLSTKDHTVLIDAGLKDSEEIILNYLEENSIKTIDYMIISHFDKDHIGSAGAVVENVDVANIIQPDYIESSKSYKRYQKAIKASGNSPVSLTEIMRFSLGSLEFTVYPPQKHTYEFVNDYSLVVSMRHGENSFLFAGDAMEERIAELLEEDNLEHTFLKVPHHGRSHVNDEAFLNAVSPKYAVVTDSEEHPVSDEVQLLLGEAELNVYYTKDGSLYCESDGTSITIVQQVFFQYLLDKKCKVNYTKNAKSTMQNKIGKELYENKDKRAS